MADYIYLLETRVSVAQRAALRIVREIAKAKSLTVFLVGGAVRDLTSGSPVRDLDVVVQGNALKLRKEIEREGGVISGEMEPGQALFVRFPGGVRMEIGSTLSVSFPKPGKPVVKPANILDDLRRRDFTANAMALSLNEGSYGLLMDPMNGVADIEARELRLVSNYGFIEDPVRMIRAARLRARLGWTLEEKTQTRYETGKQEGYISVLSDFHRGYESEEIVHEEDPLRVLKGLEAEGWMKHLAPYWTAAKVNVAELDRLRDTQSQLQMQGIHPDAAVANFPLLTSKLAAKEIAALKTSFPRQGFTAEIDALESTAKQFATQLGGKQAASPSEAWKLIVAASPEAVLWTAFSTKSPALQAKFKSFYTDWPQARQRIPYTLMQEMRITPELPEYDALLEKLFFELMDGRLTTVEEMKAFLEPYSPPAPPPPVSLRRPRTAKKESRSGKGRSKKAVVDETAESDEEAEDLPEETSTEPSEVELEGTPSEKVEVTDSIAGAAALPASTPTASEQASVKPARQVPVAKKTKSVAPEAAVTSPAKPAAVKQKSVPAKTVAAEPVKPAASKALPKAAAKPVSKPSASSKVAAPAPKSVPAKTAGKPAAAVAGKSRASGKTVPAKAVKAVAKGQKPPVKSSKPVVKSAGKGTPKPAKTAAPAKKTKSAPSKASRRR